MMTRQALRMLLVVLCCASLPAGAGNIRSVDLSTGKGLMVTGYTGADGHAMRTSRPLPLVTLWVNDALVSSQSFTSRRDGDSILWKASGSLEGVLRFHAPFSRGVHASITFRNASRDTVQLSNVVPLGEGPDRVFIRAHGPQTYRAPPEPLGSLPAGERAHRGCAS